VSLCENIFWDGEGVLNNNVLFLCVSLCSLWLNELGWGRDVDILKGKSYLVY